MGEITTRKQSESEIIALLNDKKVQTQLAAALPALGIRSDTFARWCITAMRKQPGLHLCNKPSLLGAMIQSAQLGLDPSGVSGEAYLIPFGKEVTFVPGYKGLVALMYRSGNVVDVNADVVCEGDEFAWEKGTTPFLRHKYGSKRGAYTHAWCVATLRGGGKVFTVLDRDAVMKIKKSSASGNSGPWVTSEDQMWMKSAVRRNAKLCPLSAQIMQAVGADEMAEETGTPLIVSIDDFDVKDVPAEKSEPATPAATAAPGAVSSIEQDKKDNA